jgi:hypothetical protein
MWLDMDRDACLVLHFWCLVFLWVLTPTTIVRNELPLKLAAILQNHKAAKPNSLRRSPTIPSSRNLLLQPLSLLSDQLPRHNKNSRLAPRLLLLLLASLSYYRASEKGGGVKGVVYWRRKDLGGKGGEVRE